MYRSVALALGLVEIATAAHADPSALSPPATTPPPAGAADVADPISEEKTEIGGLPLVGGDTDNGFGAGVIGNVAHLDPRFTPYAWNLEFEAFYATMTSVLHPSYEDAYLLFTMPQLFDKKLRLEIRPSFTKDNALRYFGLGNQIRDFNPPDPTRDYFTRYHPALSVNATWKFHDPWYVLGGAKYTWNKLEYSPTSTLAQDARLAEPFVRDALVIVPEHSVLAMQGAIIYDTRDNQISTYNGQYHQLEFRES